MNAIVLDVSAQLRNAGTVGKRRLVEELEPLEYYGRTLVFAKPVEIELSFGFDGEAVNVRGSISAFIENECSKCLEPFVQALEVEFDERFSAKADGEDVYSFTGEQIDVAPMVVDNILLELPMFETCREDCKGLCPKCGRNLNYGRCSCSDADE